MPSPIKILNVERFNVISMEREGWPMREKSKCERFGKMRRDSILTPPPVGRTCRSAVILQKRAQQRDLLLLQATFKSLALLSPCYYFWTTIKTLRLIFPFMKNKIIIVSLALLMAIAVSARLVAPFVGLGSLEESSSDIMVIRCGKPYQPADNVGAINAVYSDSEIEVLFVLKGTNGMGATRLQTDHDLHQGEDYLVFGNCNSSVCQAFENFKVVPIGSRFSTNLISGRSLDEQIKTLSRHALFKLNRQIKLDQEQKQQLEMFVGESK